FFIHIIKEGVYLIILLLGDRIIFMVMALGTFQSNSQNPFAQCICSIYDISCSVFLLDNAIFLCNRVVSIESCCQNLFFGGIWQQITCQLPSQKFIVGQIIVECVYYP